jgi:hypothetical protein
VPSSLPRMSQRCSQYSFSSFASTALIRRRKFRLKRSDGASPLPPSAAASLTVHVGRSAAAWFDLLDIWRDKRAPLFSLAVLRWYTLIISCITNLSFFQFNLDPFNEFEGSDMWKALEAVELSSYVKYVLFII